MLWHKTVSVCCRYFGMSAGHHVKMVLMYYTYWSSHSPPCWVGNGSISLQNIELETLVIINVVLFKGRCLTVESTFKNIRPVSWSQQDTSPCLICDFMQHFLLLFIPIFSFHYDFVSTHLSGWVCTQKLLYSRKKFFIENSTNNIGQTLYI